VLVGPGCALLGFPGYRLGLAAGAISCPLTARYRAVGMSQQSVEIYPCPVCLHADAGKCLGVGH
jgi:hypothetical protein